MAGRTTYNSGIVEQELGPVPADANNYLSHNALLKKVDLDIITVGKSGTRNSTAPMLAFAAVIIAVSMVFQKKKSCHSNAYGVHATSAAGTCMQPACGQALMQYLHREKRQIEEMAETKRLQYRGGYQSPGHACNISNPAFG